MKNRDYFPSPLHVICNLVEFFDEDCKRSMNIFPVRCPTEGAAVAKELAKRFDEWPGEHIRSEQPFTNMT